MSSTPKRYCPICKKITTQYVEPKSSRFSKNKWYSSDPDIHYFERRRRCSICDIQNTTHEISELKLSDLLADRDRLKGARILYKKLEEKLAKIAKIL